MDTFAHDGLTFDVSDDGPPDGRVVVLLHGFPEDRHSWRRVTARLQAEGYRVLAPDQRGYSPGARPSGRSAYRLGRLTSDIVALADAAGADSFDVVGHDWGSVVAWGLAADHGSRVRSLTALSVPHPGAFLHAVRHSSQGLRSWYMVFFQLPWVPEALMGLRAGGGLGTVLTRSGLDREDVERYRARAAESGAMSGPIGWYRALPLDLRSPQSPVQVPTRMVYGDRDPYIGREAVDGCARWVTADYHLDVVGGAGHWLPERNADVVVDSVLAHLASTA